AGTARLPRVIARGLDPDPPDPLFRVGRVSLPELDNAPRVVLPTDRSVALLGCDRTPIGRRPQRRWPPAAPRSRASCCADPYRPLAVHAGQLPGPQQGACSVPEF